MSRFIRSPQYGQLLEQSRHLDFDRLGGATGWTSHSPARMQKRLI